MSRLLLLALVLTAAAPSALARGPKIPLLPPREVYVPLEEEEIRDLEKTKAPALAAAPARARTPSYSRVTYQARDSRPGRSSWLLGGEIGTLGRQNKTSGDALGLRLLYGGRVFAVTRILPRIYLKPSLGYFYRRESVAKVGVSEHLIEGGASLQYTVAQGTGVNWMVGVVSRLEVSLSQASVDAPTASASATGDTELGAPALRYRLGPSLGFTYRVGNGVGLVVDMEATFSFTNPVRPYGGLTAGLVFQM